jgi:hypothetical protein
MTSRILNLSIGLTFVGGLVVFVQPSNATSTIRNAFTARYPTSTLVARMGTAAGDSCLLCHASNNRAAAGNCYKEALLARINAGRSATQAVADVDALDSDNDGIPNGVEITMARTDLAGQVGYNPGLIGATGTDPCAANTTTPITNQRETPAATPTCPADLDNGSGNGVKDGGVTIDDLLFFLGVFENGDIRADLDNGSGNGTTDGGVTIDDLLYFLIHFEGGC